MHDALYALGGRLGLDDVVAAAGRAGVDRERVRDEVQGGAWADRVARDKASGDAAGVAGTPTFFVNGVRHQGAFDAQSLIAALEETP